MNLLGSDTLAMTQQESQNSSDSELDCSALMNGSDSDNVRKKPVVRLTGLSQKPPAVIPNFINAQGVQSLVNKSINQSISCPGA